MRKVFLLLLLALSMSRAADFDWGIQRYEGRDYVSLAKVAAFYNLPQDAVPEGNKLSLARGDRSIIATRDSRDLFINGIDYVLSFPIMEQEGKFWISRMDLGQTIEPALRPELIPGIEPFDTVVLDPGHGGFDNGAASSYQYEKNFALDVARRVRNELQNAGVNVFMTRNSDTFVELPERAALANARPNSIFVSIHFNAGDASREAHGFEIYSITPRGAPSTEYDDLHVRDMVEEYGNQNERQSFALASEIFRSINQPEAQLNMFDRGVKHARFAVLRLTKVPAVLIEGGFLTNPDDARRVASTSWRNSYAKAIAAGILAYRKLGDTAVIDGSSTRSVESGSTAVLPTATPGIAPVKLRDLSP